MAEFRDILQILQADSLMPHEVAAEFSLIAKKLQDKYSDFFVALDIGGSTTSGAAVAKSILQNIEPKKAISDIDYAAVFSRPVTTYEKKLFHETVVDELSKIDLAPCNSFNVENVYLVIDEPYNMIRWMLEVKKEKPSTGARYLATRLLIPFGAIFPLSDRKYLQEKVMESLTGLSRKDADFAKEIRDQMNNVLEFRRKLKEKHIPDQKIREFLNSNRSPSSFRF